MVSPWRHLTSFVPNWKHPQACDDTAHQRPHKWSIIVCSEQPFGKNRITLESVHRFALEINLLVPIWNKSPPEVIYEL